MKRFLFILSILIVAAVGAWISVLRQGPGDIERSDVQPWPKALAILPPAVAAPGILAGEILFEDGTACEEALVELIQDGRVHWAWTGPAGDFRLEGLVPAEQQELIVLVAGHRPAPYVVQLHSDRPTVASWTLGPAIEPLPVLPEVTWGDLQGQLIGGLPLFLGERSLAGFEVWIVPKEGTDPMLALGERRIPVGIRGNFVVPGLLAGGYVARVLPEWAHGGSWPILGETPFQFEAPAQGQDRVTLSIPMVEGALHGQLRDERGESVVGAMLVLSQAGSRIWPPLQSDLDGLFQFKSLPPGDYVLELVVGETRLEQELNITPGVTKEINFGLIPRVESVDSNP
jgi:hypothetical protein